MAGFNGSGTFVRSFNWSNDAANSIPIMSSRMDTEDNGFASGLSICMTRDGQGVPTATIPFGNQILTSLGNAVSLTDALNKQTASTLYAPLNYKAYKAADESRNATTTVSADTALNITGLPVGKYEIDCFVQFKATTTSLMGLKCNFLFTGTAAATSYYMGVGVVNGSAPLINSTQLGNVFGTDLTFTIVLTSSGQWLRLHGNIDVTVSGNFSFAWAQNSSSVNNLTMFTGNWLVLTKVA